MKRKTPEDRLWQVQDTQTLFTNRVVSFVASNVTSPRTQITKEFYRFEFPAWVNIVAVTPSQEIVLIRQYRFGTGRTELEIPGGSVEPGEDPLEAGIRELQEETGYTGKNARLIGRVCPNPAIQDNCCYTVLVENVRHTATPELDPMEDIEVFTAPITDVWEFVRNGAITHGLVLNGLMFYSMDKQNNRALSPAPA